MVSGVNNLGTVKTDYGNSVSVNKNDSQLAVDDKKAKADFPNQMLKPDAETQKAHDFANQWIKHANDKAKTFANNPAKAKEANQLAGDITAKATAITFDSSVTPGEHTKTANEILGLIGKLDSL